MKTLRRSLFAGLTIGVVAAAVVWTVASASALSTTFDEPHHLATGLEWWQFGTYRWWTENPPLPKVLTALGPYLAGVRLPGRPTAEPGPWDVGISLLEDGGARTLMLARLGTLPWLLLALGITFALAGGRKQPRAAFLATALVATYPPLLGHAGLATTDIAAVATVLGFLLAFDRWVDGPSRGRAAGVGMALALASLCKLTAPLLCAVLALAWLCARRAARGTWLADGAVRAPPVSSSWVPTSHGLGNVAVGPGRRTPARYGPSAVSIFGSGGFSVHQRYAPNCHHPIPVARWCGSSNVTDSADADHTVQTTAAATIAIVNAPRMGDRRARTPLSVDQSRARDQ